ncbi:MAG: respiratory nitrate reductase subunit gamma [Candidatus Marinimicrobia bacterium]|nr:respiratory nitrate reductase subunit gamma [Candidatus Neomarinimicrobiota bacterium]
MKTFNFVLYGIFPYIAIFIFIFFSIYRYTRRGYSYSSLSSQFLENRIHFWALVPFHFGIIFIFLGHLVAFLLPTYILSWNSDLTRLYILEISAFMGGLFTLMGMLAIFIRRWTNPRAKIVTSRMDWIVLTLIMIQVLSGLGTAVFNSWGSSWFTAVANPYLMSLLRMDPQVGFIAPLPWMIQLHIMGAWLTLFLFPFSRLVHILVVPNPYLWRKPQMVRWNWNPKKRFI